MGDLFFTGLLVGSYAGVFAVCKQWALALKEKSSRVGLA